MEALVQMLKAVPKAEDYVVERKINTYGEAMLYKFMALQYTRGQWELAQKVIAILESDQVHQEVSLDGTRAVILGENLYKQHDEEPQKLEFTSEQPDCVHQLDHPNGKCVFCGKTKDELFSIAEQPESGERDPHNPYCPYNANNLDNADEGRPLGDCKCDELELAIERVLSQQPPADSALEAVREANRDLSKAILQVASTNPLWEPLNDIRDKLRQALAGNSGAEPVRCDCGHTHHDGSMWSIKCFECNCADWEPATNEGAEPVRCEVASRPCIESVNGGWCDVHLDYVQIDPSAPRGYTSAMGRLEEPATNESEGSRD